MWREWNRLCERDMTSTAGGSKVQGTFLSSPVDATSSELKCFRCSNYMPWWWWRWCKIHSFFTISSQTSTFFTFCVCTISLFCFCYKIRICVFAISRSRERDDRKNWGKKRLKEEEEEERRLRWSGDRQGDLCVAGKKGSCRCCQQNLTRREMGMKREKETKEWLSNERREEAGNEKKKRRGRRALRSGNPITTSRSSLSFLSSDSQHFMLF